MKNIKNLSLLVAAALITISAYAAQTVGTKPANTTQPAAAKSSLLANQKPLKMQPPTKVPAAKPVQPAAKPAGAAAK